MIARTGILLPQSVLSSSWFAVLATVVAFNTIIYIGLTLSKLVPMPRQFHPRRVRSLVRRIGMDPERSTAVDDIPRPDPALSDSPYDRMRGEISGGEIPLALTLVGVLVVAVSLVTLVLFGSTGRSYQILEMCTGVALLLAALLLGRGRARAGTARWIWAICSIGLVAVLCYEAWGQGNQAPLAYCLIVMTAFGPVTLGWRPAITAAVVMVALLSTTVRLIDGTEGDRLIAAGVAAVLVSAALLRLRLGSIEALSDEQARSTALATTDVLTGTLSRAGLLSLVPGVAAVAERTGSPIFLIHFDIASLARANAQYGTAYGDDILRTVATAIQQRVRAGDLISRWGGDEFLVVGVGGKPNAVELGTRIQESVRQTGVNLGKWPTTVRVGTASGDPRETTFDDLLARAEADSTNPTQAETGHP